MKFKSLKMKLLFLMSVLAFLVSIVASTILFAVEYNKLAKETELSLNQLLSVIEESAAVAVAAQNKKSAQYILDDLVLNDFISSAEIKSEPEVPLAVSSPLVRILIVALGKLVAVSVPNTSPIVSAARLTTEVTFPERLESKLDCVTLFAKVHCH